MFRRFFIALLMAFLVASFCGAASVPWKSSTYSYIAKGESVRDVLKQFCAVEGIPVVISEKVKGVVNGRFVNYSPQRFFELLVKAYGLLWYYDGSVLYVYSSDEVASSLIELRYKSFDEFVQTLKRLGIYDPRFPMRIAASSGVLFVSGPPKYVELVAKAAKLFDRAYAKEEVRIFKLRYAWADDHTFIVNDQQVTVPGVASILRGILAGKMPSGASVKVKQLGHTLEKLRGKGLVSVGKEKKEKAKEHGAVASKIVADGRLNAVIVRDTRDKMPLYQQLISLLDVPAGLVQIEVTISDVSTDSLKELGFNWRVNTYSGPNKDKIDLGVNAPKNFAPGEDWMSVGTGLNMATTISLYHGRYVLSRLRLLEQKGKAKILSRPSVLTVNNVQAVIQQTSTFYARVAGEHDVDLFNITAGIVLKVTPHIIEEDGRKKIKLFVDIEDGSVQFNQQVDNLPVVPKSSIHTQAVVSENQVLVLGGYVFETNSKTVKSVPVLGHIPLLGALFRYTSTQKGRRERIFMIHARIVNPENPETQKVLSKNGR